MEKKKVLIIDDEENVRRLLCRILGERVTVLEARDGEEGVQIASTQKPHLILMDILMPKMDGYTACTRIKTDPSTRTIPVVMLTALGLKLNMKLAEDLGASGYLTKPFNTPELLEMVNRFLATPD